MTRTLVAVLVAVGFATAVGAADPVGRYAVVVNDKVADGPWGKVVKALEAKYKGKTFAYDKSIENVRKQVGEYHPRYVCFVCPPTENFPDFALAANKFCRTLDDDPYVDAIWGILTGFDEDHALELAKAEPVVIQRAFTKTLGGWLNWVPEGDYVTEWTKDRGEIGEKTKAAEFAVKKGGPTSDTEDAKYVHKLLSDDKSDLIIGSGHGGHHNWMLMYPSGKSYLTAKDGKLTMTAPDVELTLALKATGQTSGSLAASMIAPDVKLPLTASRPKVYWAVGNCLTGVVNKDKASFKNSYALAWMKNGAKQYIGAVQSTWYELNWNMADWFLKQEGRWTFAESLFLLRQWSQYLLNEKIVTGRDREGTEFTDGIFVLYGDPALSARVEKAREPALTETLDIQETKEKDVVRITYKVKVNYVGEGNKRTAEKYDGWRIFCHLLPYQVTDAKVEKSDFEKVVCPGETLIWDAGKGLKVGDERSVTLTAKRVKD